MGLAAPWSGEPSWPRVEPTSPALAGDLFTAGPLGKPWLWFWDASPWQLMMLHLFPCVLAVPHPLHTSGSAIVKVTANSLLLSVSGLPSTLSSGPVVLKWTMLWWLLLDHFSSDLIHGLLTSASCCLLPFPHGYLKGISDLTCCKQNSCWFFFFSFSLTQIHFFPDFSAWMNGTPTTLHLAHQLNPSGYIQLLTTATA